VLASSRLKRREHANIGCATAALTATATAANGACRSITVREHNGPSCVAGRGQVVEKGVKLHVIGHIRPEPLGIEH
jgi:hypothetical protein